MTVDMRIARRPGVPATRDCGRAASVPVGKKRLIQVDDYDPQWPLAFSELSGVITATLGDLVTTIEHVGSTAVPGLAATPIIDLDVVIESDALLSDVVRSLATLGYGRKGDLGIAGREAFGREDHDAPRDGTGRAWADQHLYAYVRGSEELVRHVAFRDFLRQEPHEASAYAALKRRLAKQYPHDIDSHIEGKTVFVEGILRRSQL